MAEAVVGYQPSLLRVSKLTCLQRGSSRFRDQDSLTVPDAMKRTAPQAGFPVESPAVRVTVCIPADRCTRNESMVFSLVCHNSDNVDAVKKILTYRIREATGRCPQLSFQLHQNGRQFQTYHITGHSGCSAFRSDCSRLQGPK